MKLVLDSIRKDYGKKTVLHKFSAVFTPGVYGLLGPNGAGKTTLMRIVADVLKPNDGKIYYNDKDKNILNEKYRDQLGYLPQDLGMYGSFTARRFLMYIAALKGIDRKSAEAKVEQLANATNLTEHLDTKCRKYSGGMKRRLGIAQSLLNNPSILILDEPTSGLDPMERIRFRNMISEISQNRIVILSTHIVSDADMISKHIIFLGKGRIIREGTISELQNIMVGRVWLARVQQRDLPSIGEKFTLTNIIQKDNDAEIRIVCDHKPFNEATPTSPLLEDSYLYYFKYLENGGN